MQSPNDVIGEKYNKLTFKQECVFEINAAAAEVSSVLHEAHWGSGIWTMSEGLKKGTFTR